MVIIWDYRRKKRKRFNKYGYHKLKAFALFKYLTYVPVTSDWYGLPAMLMLPYLTVMRYLPGAKGV